MGGRGPVVSRFRSFTSFVVATITKEVEGLHRETTEAWRRDYGGDVLGGVTPFMHFLCILSNFIVHVRCQKLCKVN